MLKDAEILAQLRDIHLPPPISAWALSGLRIFILLMLLSLIGLSLFYAYRAYQAGRASREALRLLAGYEKEYQLGASPQVLSAQISQLLRRVALAYFLREDIASLQGRAWLDFLNSTGKGISFNAVQDSLLVLPYQSNLNSAPNLEALLVCAKRWIRARRKLCLS